MDELGRLQYHESMSTITTPDSVDDVLESVVECLTPDVARRLLAVRMNPRVQARVDELATKANAGDLNAEERVEYETLIDRADLLGIFKAMARQVLSRP